MNTWTLKISFFHLKGMWQDNLLSALWVRYHRFLPHLRRAALLLTATLVIIFDTITYFTYDIKLSEFTPWETLQLLIFIIYVFIKDERIGATLFSVFMTAIFIAPETRPMWAWALIYIIIVDLLVANKTRTAFVQLFIFSLAQFMSGLPLFGTIFLTFFWAIFCASASIIIRSAKEHLEEMQQEAERSREVAAELIQQLRRDIADSLHDDLAADLTRMLIISRSIRLPHSDDRDRVLDLQDRTQQALAHLRLLIHNLAVSQGPPKEEPTLQEIVDSSTSTLAQREIVLDADLDGIERIPALHRSELGRLLVAFIRENTLNALKYNSPHDLVSLFVEQEQDTLFISFSSPWHDQKVPEEMHGGYGLWALQDRFENAGGSLSSNRIGASWTVLASLPWNEIATPTTNARSLMSPPDGAAYA